MTLTNFRTTDSPGPELDLLTRAVMCCQTTHDDPASRYPGPESVNTVHIFIKFTPPEVFGCEQNAGANYRSNRNIVCGAPRLYTVVL